MNTLIVGGSLLLWMAAFPLANWRRRARPTLGEARQPSTRQQNREPDARRAEQMLERMAEGVLLLDPNMRPTFANRAARSLLGLQAESLPARLPSQQIAENVRRANVNLQSTEDEIEMYFPRRLTLRVQASPLDDEGAVMVVLLDVTEERKTQRIRREFVAHASHELKSPVASLQALAEAVTEALPDDLETAERFAERMLKESERLAKLVTDLLDLSRLEDPTRLPEEPCDLTEVVRREVAAARPAADNSRVSFTSNVDAELVMKGDPQQLSLLVRNLLENAIQYTPGGGAVDVTARRSAEKVVIEVTDNGPGIPVDSRSRIFERFYRLDKGRSRDRGGTGLGLAIVKHVAELHQGSIELESELGEGSTFRVVFPAMTGSTGPNEKTTHKEST